MKEVVDPSKNWCITEGTCQKQRYLKQLHARILKCPSFEYPSAIASLLTFSTRLTSSISYAQVIFQNLGRRTTFIYNTMIRCYVLGNLPRQATLCYKDMMKEGLIKNNYTFTPLIKACSMLLPDVTIMGRSVHGHVVRLGFSHDPFIASALIEFYASSLDMRTAEQLFAEVPTRDVVLWTCMIDGFRKIENAEKARALFDEMPERNAVSWSALMAAYLQVCNYKEVLYLYKEMECSGISPNESALVTALTACAHLGALPQGIWMHSLAEKLNYISNPILATTLIDMYSKCGCAKMALKVFEEMINRDSGAWNTIIAGLAMNGDSAKSLQLFDEMISSSTQPTEATFVAALTACTHSKLIDKGLHVFKSMSSIYNIEPNMAHYACMVDLFARSGMLEEAEKFVNETIGRSVIHDMNILGALLGACRTYGKVEIGNRIWRKIAEKEKINFGVQVVVYNMYREAGWDDEAATVRRSIHRKQGKKVPGCSAIEVNGVVQEFVAGEMVHPHAERMRRVLQSALCHTIAEHELFLFSEQ